MADVTYCGHYECTAKECMRHYTHVPAGRDVSWAMFDCPYMPLDSFDGYEPVVHARWMFYEDGSGEWWDKCSRCGGKIPNEGGYCCGLPRCPHCGAYMDEEAAE